MKAVKIALLARKCYKKKMVLMAQILKNINRILFACDISYKADISDSIELPHQGLGVVIGDGCVIGDDTIIRQNCTIGGKLQNGRYAFPIIGKNVMIGAGAVVLGGIHIGDNVKIGANAVVVKDVPDNVTVVGIPAKNLRE